MSQPSALPGLLSPEAVQLIDGQYADRPHLRPILDAVLAAIPSLGAVTVEARKTLVSLVTPRRTFAIVQATTKNRVDLGLRLEGPGAPEPGARLRPAKNLGPATVRIPLTEPAELDGEALGWLRLAYEQNTASPPPRRRPAPRPRPEPTPLTVVIEARGLPGRSFCAGPDAPSYQNVHLALRGTSKDRPGLTVPDHPWRAIEPVPGDATSARWEVEVTIRRGADGLDFGGPFIRGDRTDRHLALAWGDVGADGTFRLFRGAKLRLGDLDPGVIEQALRPGARLAVVIRFTDADGRPIRPTDVTWSVVGSS
jgi:Family of unknown function (DUF5990)/Domain of unknown function (DUF5655)